MRFSAEKITELQLHAVPLPATREEMLARKTMPKMGLNDYVDQIHATLFPDNEHYTKLLAAVHGAHAVEGSLVADNLEAARMIREYATKHGIPYVPEEKLAVLMHSLKIVLRRYKMERKQRAKEFNIPPGGKPQAVA